MKTAYIIVHGFGGNPKDVYGIRDGLLKYEINENNIYLPLIYGHNIKKRGFTFGTTYTEMIEYLKKDVKNISLNYDKIVLIGYSMGALLTMCVSIKIKIDKLILINPPIKIWDFKSFRFWLKDDIKKRRLFHTKTVLKSMRYKTIRNNLELRKLRLFTMDNISKITTDTYVVQSIHDYVAKPISGKYVYDNISSQNKGISYYSTTSHFIPSEKDVEIVVSDLQNWLKN